MADPPNMNTRIANAMIDHDVDLLRVAASSNRRVRGLLKALERELVARLDDVNLSDVMQTRLRTLLSKVRQQIDQTYGEINRLVQNDLLGVAALEVELVARTANTVIGIDVLNPQAPRVIARALIDDLLIRGAPSADWWSRQAADTAFRFATQVRIGVLAGDPTPKIARRVRQEMDVSRRAAEALVRTSVQTVATNARLASYKANGDVVTGVQQLSVLDNRTTDICIAYSGLQWDLDGNPLPGTKLPFNGGPPRHWNCRSTLVPILKTWRDMGIDVDEFQPSTRAAMNGEVAATTTFAQWLASRSEEQQDEILGKGRAQLWRDGRITLTDLVDQTGRPMTLEQLRAKHGV